MSGLLAELKRRNVFRVGMAYMVLSWVLLQVGDVVFEALKLGTSANTLLLAILAIGFIPALIFAWVFELTPEGLVVDSGGQQSEASRRSTEKKLNITVIVLLLVGIGLLIVDRLLPKAAEMGDVAVSRTNMAPRDAAANRGNAAKDSIAVLPFVNMSPDADNEYFSDGISEEILNVLVRIPGLKVAGRTSSFSFKGRNLDLRDIGAALDVKHVLEGSVRRSGDNLRITAQLIRSDTGFHLWSKTYDRQLLDVFDIQEDIAISVATELALSLGLEAGNNLVPDRTDDIVAYEKYLRAKQLYLQRGLDNLTTALLLLQEVVARDPGFAPAWANIAAVYSVYESWQPTQPPLGDYLQWRAIGSAAARQAIELDPDNAEAHVSLGWFLFYGRDFAAALKAMDRAVELAPENPTVLDDTAQSLLQVGYINEAMELSRRAIAVDPLVPIFQKTLGVIYMEGKSFLTGIDAYAAAVEQFRKVMTLNKTFPDTYENIFWIRMRQSKFDQARAIAEEGAVAGAFTETQLHDFIALVDAAQESDAALRQLGEELDDGFVHFQIAEHLQDVALTLATSAADWDSDYLREPFYFSYSDARVYQQAQWKDQIRQSGVLDLWRARGFPPQCQPVGEDDFDCS
jgi:TolB-like protein